MIYHNYPELTDKDGKKFFNRIPSDLDFPATKASGYDTFIEFNGQKKRYKINSNHPKLSELAEKLGIRDVRGVFIFSPNTIPSAADSAASLCLVPVPWADI